MELLTLRNGVLGTLFAGFASLGGCGVSILIDDSQNLSAVRKAYRLHQKIVTLEDGKQYGVFEWGDTSCKTVSAHRVLTMDIHKTPLSFSTGRLYPSQVCL